MPNHYDLKTLLGDDPFDPFKPLHPAFTRTANVHVFEGSEKTFTVDLGEHYCSCKMGAPYEWHNNKQRWAPNLYCLHKLKVMSRIVEDDRFETTFMPYQKALATRYNAYEIASAFHKELRRGNYPGAVYFGSIMAAHRGEASIIRYLLNILYEETRDHAMGEYLLSQYTRGETGIADSLRPIMMFCKSIKKWELPHRLPIFLAEMAAYNRLADEFGNDVAKGGDIIDNKHGSRLMACIHTELRKPNPDLAKLQYGLKGMQKLQHNDNVDLLREGIFEALQTFAKSPESKRLVTYINKRKAAKLGIGYHELNALCDLLAGEPYGAGVMPPAKLKAYSTGVAAPPELAALHPIPLYAHDNHTWKGKGLIRHHADQLKPGADQTKLDFRLCGAYFGVAWRHLAFNQHGSINVPWGDVSWPAGLHKTVMRLFY